MMMMVMMVRLCRVMNQHIQQRKEQTGENNVRKLEKETVQREQYAV